MTKRGFSRQAGNYSCRLTAEDGYVPCSYHRIHGDDARELLFAKEATTHEGKGSHTPRRIIETTADMCGMRRFGVGVVLRICIVCDSSTRGTKRPLCRTFADAMLRK